MAKTPHFAIRLDRETKTNLVQMGKVFGSPNVSAFARELLTTFASGDVERARAFVLRLADRAGEQLKLSLNASFDEAAKAQKPTAKPRKRAKPTSTKAPKRKPR